MPIVGQQVPKAQRAAGRPVAGLAGAACLSNRSIGWTASSGEGPLPTRRQLMVGLWQHHCFTCFKLLACWDARSRPAWRQRLVLYGHRPRHAGAWRSLPYALNDSGQVVGYSQPDAFFGPPEGES